MVKCCRINSFRGGLSVEVMLSQVWLPASTVVMHQRWFLDKKILRQTGIKPATYKSAKISMCMCSLAKRPTATFQLQILLWPRNKVAVQIHKRASSRPGFEARTIIDKQRTDTWSPFNFKSAISTTVSVILDSQNCLQEINCQFCWILNWIVCHLKADL